MFVRRMFTGHSWSHLHDYQGCMICFIFGGLGDSFTAFADPFAKAWQPRTPGVQCYSEKALQRGFA
jgi:hypothetical protein